MEILLGISGEDDEFLALSKLLSEETINWDSLTIAILDSDNNTTTTETITTRVNELLETTNRPVTTTQLPGDPGSQLVEHAETNDFDAIAIGGGERSPLGKLTLNQTAEFVVLNSKITVLLVR